MAQTGEKRVLNWGGDDELPSPKQKISGSILEVF
jgi:hypothetical protein